MPQERRYANQAQRQAAYRRRTENARQAQLHSKGLPTTPAIATMPGSARWKAALMRATELVSMVHEEMQDYFDERTETWQESERGEQHEERRAAVEEVLDALTGLDA
jgi:hypothetical protein